MNATYFALETTGKLKKLTREELLSLWNHGKSGDTFWIDVEDFRSDEIDPWLADFEIPPLIRERCLGVREATIIVPLEEACYIEAASYSDKDYSTITHAASICLPHLLITLHPVPIHALQKFKEADVYLTPHIQDTAQLLLALLLVKTDETSRISRELLQKVQQFDERLDRKPTSVSADELLDIKQAISDLVRVSEEQEECFGALATVDTQALDFSSLVGNIKLLTTMSASVNRRADRLETRIGDLRNRYQMAQQERGNHRLTVLTVISAVFLPLSLLAGIWGMNFEHMPELSLPHAYFFALGTMALVAVGMIWFLYKRGWFD